MSLTQTLSDMALPAGDTGTTACAGPVVSCSLESAISAWETALGSRNVKCDEGTRRDYAKTTLPAGTRPLVVLYPSTTEQVQSVVRIAERFNVALHAISRGKNWGYGDACAPTDGQAIVDLSRMNRIRELNVELGYAVIEPGVSQGQMYQYLQDNHIPLLLDVTGAGPDASIVGNILQRGFGHTPYGDRFRHTSGLQVVLGDGSVVRTGFGQYDNAKAAHVFPWGVGPWTDGLYTQSNLGIVTSACVWLMPRPDVIEGFALKIGDEESLGKVIGALRRLRMNGTVRSAVHVANDLRVLSSRMTYPWQRARGQVPLSDALRAELRHEHGVGAWNLLGGLYGSEGEVRAARRVVRREFRGIARVQFFRRRLLRAVRQAAPLLSWQPAGRRLVAGAKAVEEAFDLLEGVPSTAHLAGAFWRSKGQANEQSDIRNAGLIWVSPVLPMTAEAAREVLNIHQDVVNSYGFDPLVTMTAVSERALCCVTSINYDRQDSDERSRASECADALHTSLAAEGYYPYRTASCS